MTIEEYIEQGVAAEHAFDAIQPFLAEREARTIKEMTLWFRDGAEGEHRALAYAAVLSEIYALREELDWRIRKGAEARTNLMTHRQEEI